MEVIQKQLEDERARIPKATPYPYTTDYPVVQFFSSILGNVLKRFRGFRSDAMPHQHQKQV